MITLLQYMESPITSDKKATQRETILKMLRKRNRYCYEFTQSGIMQYNARIKELREQGHDIQYLYGPKLFVLFEKFR